jgi:hypothetical protein
MLFEFQSCVLVYVMCHYEFMIISQVCSCQISYKIFKNLDKMQLDFKEGDFVIHLINK